MPPLPRRLSGQPLKRRLTMRRRITISFLIAASFLGIAVVGTAPAAKAEPICIRVHFPPAPPIVICTP